MSIVFIDVNVPTNSAIKYYLIVYLAFDINRRANVLVPLMQINCLLKLKVYF